MYEDSRMRCLSAFPDLLLFCVLAFICPYGGKRSTVSIIPYEPSTLSLTETWACLFIGLANQPPGLTDRIPRVFRKQCFCFMNKISKQKWFVLSRLSFEKVNLQNIVYLKIFMCMNVCLHACLCTLCVPGAYRGWKESDHPELQLQMVVSHCVGIGNGTQVLGKNHKCS